MRKVFLDELPRTKNDGISWKDYWVYKSHGKSKRGLK